MDGAVAVIWTGTDGRPRYVHERSSIGRKRLICLLRHVHRVRNPALQRGVVGRDATGNGGVADVRSVGEIHKAMSKETMRVFRSHRQAAITIGRWAGETRFDRGLRLRR